jgi:hemerythrin-like domain-containing protein
MTTATITTSPMTGLLDRNIKDVIREYPETGVLLEESGIGCVACSVGTCRLKDVVSIHGLSETRERELFTRIAAIVFPGQNVSIPRLERAAATRSSGAARFSPPMKDLVEEHTVIKRVIALIPAVTARLAAGLGEAEKQTLEEIIDFVRHFADRYHHAKEEDLLFKYFDEKSDILQAMLSEHEIGRGHIRAIREALDRRDAAEAGTHLAAYGALLTEHIRKEDEILYPWMDRELTDAQIGQLFARFREVDDRFGDKPARYRAWVAAMETSRAEISNQDEKSKTGKAGGL